MSVDLSEMSDWDGTQAPPSLSLSGASVSPRTRAVTPGPSCLMGFCASCGRTLLSAVEVQFVGQFWQNGERSYRDVLHCGRCFEWPHHRYPRARCRP